mmetsp:Transcript_5709/g.8687  ORF Transcript_5709/g.8687 Transcript_5709/m.8687 type:complete len:606 (-) Transcript_5709:376-2193(-)
MSDSEEDSYDDPVETKRSSFAWHRHQYALTMKIHERFSLNVKVKRDDSLVGYLDGNLLPRPTPHFFSFADEVSQELQELSVLFCDQNGRADRIRHPHLDEEAIRGGGFLQVYILEVQPEEQGRDFGLRVLHETLLILKDRWTLAVMMPSSLADRMCHWEGNRRLEGNPHNLTLEQQEQADRNNQRVTRHFARMRFTQAGKSEAWFLTRKHYFQPNTDPMACWLSKDQARAIEIVKRPKITQPVGLHKILVDKVLAFPSVNQGPAIQELESLVYRGASVNDSGSLQVAVANQKDDPVLFQTLIRLGGNIHHADALGNTPLHVAAAVKNAPAIEYLMSNGANPSATNSEGDTPLQCFQHAEQSADDFRAAFGWDSGPVRQVDVVPKLRCLQGLLPQSTKSLLTDGWMSPRMKEMLLTTAALEMDSILHESQVNFQRNHPMPLSACCDFCNGINRIDYIPASVLSGPINQNGLYKSFHDGWGLCFKAIHDALKDGHTPTIHQLEQYLTSGNYDYRKYQHFLTKGGKVEFAVDAVLNITRNVAVDGDDGWEYCMFQNEIEAHPSTPLDKAFDIARFKCINEGGGVGSFRGPYRETRRLGEDLDDMDGNY